MKNKVTLLSGSRRYCRMFAHTSRKSHTVSTIGNNDTTMSNPICPADRSWLKSP